MQHGGFHHKLQESVSRRTLIGNQVLDLNEIQAALLRLPVIHDAVVLAKASHIGETQELVAYIILIEEEFASEQLQSHLMQLLPTNDISISYVLVSTIPLTTEGLVDEQALLQLEPIDPSVVSQLSDVLRLQPNIDQLATVVRGATHADTPFHLADVLPDWKASATGVGDQEARLALSRTEVHEYTSQKLAISHGEPPQELPLNLVAALQHAATQNHDRGLIYLHPDGSEQRQTYRALLQDAQRIGAGLRSLGLQPNDKVIMQVEQPDKFIPALWGCIVSGLIPVPMTVAPSYEQQNNTLSKLESTWQLLNAPFILADQKLVAPLHSLARKSSWSNFRIAALEDLPNCEPHANVHSSQPHDLALLLFTSGSTGTPKGVMLSHRNILSQVVGLTQKIYQARSKQADADLPPYDISFNWLPLDHVGSLVASHFRDVYSCSDQVHTLSTTILQDPLKWLDVVDQYKVTITWAPNFAFGLINDQLMKPDEHKWDLSSLYFIINAGDTVVPATARRFLKHLHPYGLPSTAMHPAWGMSETSSGATYAEHFSCESSSQEDHWVELGGPIAGVSLRIVDEHNQVVKEGIIGRFQIKGLTVTFGYYQNPQANQNSFTEDGWLDTGDLGLLKDGRLTLTGRAKDAIIINGVNYYSHEIETIVEELNEVVPSYTAACGVRTGSSSTDQLAIFFHAPHLTEAQLRTLLKEIRTRVVRAIGVHPDYLLPLEEEMLPKTGLGKIQRTQLKHQFEAGHFDHLIKHIDILTNTNTLPAWFYYKTWHLRQAQYSILPAQLGCSLLFLDSAGVGKQLADLLGGLQPEKTSICVEPGPEFARINMQYYRINPRIPEHYQQLLECLRADNHHILQIIHLWTYASSVHPITTLEELEQSQDQGLYSVLFLFQALAQSPWPQEKPSVKVYVVSSGSQGVYAEEDLAYEKSTVLGLLKTASQELSWLQWCHIDLPGDMAQLPTQAHCILQELLAAQKDQEVAYRDEQRFIPQLTSMKHLQKLQNAPALRSGGLYLLTGGLGGVGKELASYLLENYQAKLLIVGRTPLPEQNRWDEFSAQEKANNRLLQTYLALKQISDEFIYEDVDVCDLRRLQTMIIKAEQQWNRPLDGVFHLAGVVGERPLVNESKETIAEILRSKVLGTWTLHQLLKDRASLLFVTFSSVNGFFASKNAGAYAAANSFLDNFVLYQRHTTSLQSYCFAWSMWDDIGMSHASSLKNFVRAHGFTLINPAQGMYSLLVGLRQHPGYMLIGLDGSKQWVQRFTHQAMYGLQKVSVFFTSSSAEQTSELQQVVDSFKLTKQIELVRLAQMPLTDTGEIDIRQLSTLDQDTESHPTKLIEPRTEIERKLAHIWQTVLGIPRVSVQDNFFELGGHSLLAGKFITYARDMLQIELSLETLFETPVLEQLAEQVEELLARVQKVQTDQILPALRQGNIPLSFAQQRLWFLDQLVPGNSSYNIPINAQLSGELDTPSLERSLQEIVLRHESLRTTFHMRASKGVQIINPAVTFNLKQIDLSSFPQHERKLEVLRLARAEIALPFDLTRDLPLRATLLHLSKRKHVLLLTVHHIAADGWSTSILIRELTLIYPAFVQGKSSPLVELALQYADFAIWQRNWLQGEVQAKQLAYWQQQLRGTPAQLTLPTDYPRPSVQTYHGSRLPFQLSPSLTERLNALSRNEGTTLFMTLYSALAVLLFYYTGQEDIVIGTTHANRKWVEIEDLIGFFANTLVLRVNLFDNPSFQEVLARVKEVCLGAYAHQDLPFEKLVEELQPQRDLSHSPLFQVMFVLQNTPQAHFDLPNLTVSHLSIESETVNFDVIFEIVETEQTLSGQIKYNTDLFKAATISRLFEHWQRLLTILVDSPQSKLSDLSLLGALERQQILMEWNATQKEYPKELCLHQLFEAQVVKTPNDIAVIYENEQLTFDQLNKCANHLAYYLQTLGVGPDVLVGVCVERSLDMVIALLAILKAGGAYVPLDPSYPTDRLSFMVEDAAIRILLTQKQWVDRLPMHNLHVICLDMALEVPAQALQGKENPSSGVKVTDLAYVIYTSGSTGRPKGVMISHHAICNRLLWMQDTYPLTATDKVLQKTPYTFDVSVWEFFWPLFTGAKLVMARRDGHRDRNYLIKLITSQQITVMHFVPSMLQAFLATRDVQACKSLRHVFCSGEVLPPELQHLFFTHFSEVNLHNLYGPTEAAIDVTAWHCQRESKDQIVPIGYPIANVKIYVLNAYLQPVPVGVSGELYIGGEALARGYLRRDDLTAEKFILDPFSDEAEAKLYRTGDLARYRPDGAIEYIGRIDHQVKIRGFRIELGDIEANLSQHPDIRESIVLVQEGEQDDKYLVAYVVPSEQTNKGVNLSHKELRNFLQAKLPEYMIPSTFVTLNLLPLMANGKVDRKVLPVARRTRGEQGIYMPARTPTEEILATLWKEILGLEQIGIQDNFFEVGGHSLLALQLIDRIRSSLQVEISLQSLFKIPTIADIAAIVTEMQDLQTGLQDVPSSFPSLVPEPDKQFLPFPLTDVQQAYWVGRSGTFELGNVAAHSYREFDYSPLDLARYTQAWQKLVERHAMLRAIIQPDGHQQVLANVPPYEIKLLDLRGQDPQTVTEHLESIRADLTHQIIKTEQWPLFEIRATLLDNSRTRIHVSIDALLMDGWSQEIIFQELTQLYEDPETPLPPLELTFRDYVLAEASLQASDFYRRSQAYWQKRLATLPPAPDLPLAQSPSALAQPHFVRWASSLNPASWQRLKARAMQAGLTPSGILLAAFAETLTAWSKSPRFTINLTLFHRLLLHPQVNEVVGDFTSLTLLEVDNSHSTAFEARARRLQEQLWSDLDHRYYSGVRVLRDLARQRGGMPQALMPVVFTSTLVYDAEHHNKRVPFWREPVYSISQTPQIWLDHVVVERDQELLFHWDAVEALFPPMLLDSLFEAYCQLLQSLAKEETTWQNVSMNLLPAEQRQLLVDSNATDTLVSADLLHMLFVKQVPQRPQQAAVISSRRTLTYEQVYRYACHLGADLRKQGARPNKLVAVVMEKGWEQVVAVLGILLSGAAYLPLDPALPPERLRYMLEHGEVEIALTQAWIDQEVAWPESIQRLCVDAISATSLNLLSSLEPVQKPEDLAYVIFTSGSTGLPKGVMISHQGAVNTILDINERFGIGSADCGLALSSLSFDLSVYDIFGILAAGGTIVLPAADDLHDPASWASLIIQHQVTVWNSVPAFMQMLTEYVETQPTFLAHDSLRLVLLSGDWIPLSLPDRLKLLIEGIEVVSLGGATEASIWSIFYPFKAVDSSWKSIPYGKPMRNQQFHVLNELLEPCPVWVTGQLYISGIGLAQGYWRDEEKTKSSFFLHPRTGERLYRTGDLGRYLPDGNIEFLGREDFQVKVHGYRIELGEVEAALEQHQAVGTAIVKAVGDQEQGKQLVAYIVPNNNDAISSSAEVVNNSVSGVAYREQCPVMIQDELEQIAFKLNEAGVRKAHTGQASISLLCSQPDEQLVQTYLKRQSYRTFTQQVISLANFSEFIGCLRQIRSGDWPLPKYRYASAGSLYPIQTYIYVKPDRIQGIGAGIYYYHPKEHRLVLLVPEARLESDIHAEINRDLFSASAFSLFLIAQLNAITPLYKEKAQDYCFLEAGYMSQLLMSMAPDNEIGLCPVGDLDFKRIGHLFDLEESHMFLHCLVGGRIDPTQSKHWGGMPTHGSLASPLSEQLKAFLHTKLPAYMVPGAFVFLENLPLTANGKVDRNALPAPESLTPERTTEYVAPSTDIEQRINQIWREKLQIDKIGLYDNFFDLGGNSVSLVQVYHKLTTELRLDLSLPDLFKYPTIDALTRYLEDKLHAIPVSRTEEDRRQALHAGKDRLTQLFRQRQRNTKRGD